MTHVGAYAGQPHVDVRAFGAVGDSTTDDDAAVKRAAAACTPGTVLLLPPLHTFKIRQLPDLSGRRR